MQYFSHPIITAILKNPGSSKAELCTSSGLDAKTFARELKMLLDDHHVGKPWDEYLPRKHTLAVYNKNGKRQIQEIELNYISLKDLHHLLFPEEDWTDYEVSYDFTVAMMVGVNKVTQEQLTIIQSISDVKLDLSQHDYYLASQYMDLAEEKLAKEKTYEDITIIHLDDQTLFSSSFEKEMKELFPGVNWLYFSYVEDALKCIEEKLKEEETINLIITDVNHLGRNGYDFATVVRDLEADYHCFRSSILIYTFVIEEDPRIQKGLDEEVFTQYLPKSVHGKELKNIVLRLLVQFHQLKATMPMIWN